MSNDIAKAIIMTKAFANIISLFSMFVFTMILLVTMDVIEAGGSEARALRIRRTLNRIKNGIIAKSCIVKRAMITGAKQRHALPKWTIVEALEYVLQPHLSPLDLDYQ